MTEQEIISHFGDREVYRFTGSLTELNDLQLNTGNSYNYIVVQGTVYFVSQYPVSDLRAVALVKE